MLERKAEFASENQFKKVLDPIASPEKKKLTKPDKELQKTTHEEGDDDLLEYEYHELANGSKLSSTVIAQRLEWENAQAADKMRKENAKLAALQQTEEAKEQANALDNEFKMVLHPIASSEKPRKAPEHKKMSDGDLLETWRVTEQKNATLTKDEELARKAQIKEINELAEGSDKKKEEELRKGTQKVVNWYKSITSSHFVEDLLHLYFNTSGKHAFGDRSLLANQWNVGGVDPTIEVFTSPKITMSEEKEALPPMAPPSIRMG